MFNVYFFITFLTTKKRVSHKNKEEVLLHDFLAGDRFDCTDYMEEGKLNCESRPLILEHLSDIFVDNTIVVIIK